MPKAGGGAPPETSGEEPAPAPLAGDPPGAADVASVSAAAVDWPALLPAVARELLGEPPGGDRGPAWRYGRRGSLAVHVAGERAGTWHDFEAGAGGGVVDLVQRELATDRTGALAWLRLRGHLPADASGLPRRPEPPRDPPQRPKSKPGPAGESRAAADRRSGDDAQAVQRARGLWDAAEPLQPGALAWTYLTGEPADGQPPKPERTGPGWTDFDPAAPFRDTLEMTIPAADPGPTRGRRTCWPPAFLAGSDPPPVRVLSPDAARRLGLRPPDGAAVVVLYPFTDGGGALRAVQLEALSPAVEALTAWPGHDHPVKRLTRGRLAGAFFRLPPRNPVRGPETAAEAVVVEGPLDTLAAAWLWPGAHILGSGGSIGRLQPGDVAGCGRVILAGDGDAAGRKAALQAAEALRRAGVDVEVWRRANDADPADVLAQRLAATVGGGGAGAPWTPWAWAAAGLWPPDQNPTPGDPRP